MSFKSVFERNPICILDKRHRRENWESSNGRFDWLNNLFQPIKKVFSKRVRPLVVLYSFFLFFFFRTHLAPVVQAGSMKEPLQSLAYSIFSICTKHSISIDIQWIPRKENTKADYISKMVDHEDWGVTDNFFEFIRQSMGTSLCR